MNLVLTGSSGFVGTALLNAIENDPLFHDANIILLSSVPHNRYVTIPYSSYQFSMGDFKKHGIFEIDYFIHLGSFTPKSSISANDIGKCNTNINSTQFLLENLPPITRRFLYISSLDVYGNCEDPLITEHTQANPSSMYGWSKLYCEKMVAAHCQQNEIEFQILRLGHIYGKGEDAYKKIIPQTIRSLISGIPPKLFTTGSEKRCFLHISDCCRIILKSMLIPETVGLLNLVSSSSTTIADVMQLLIEISGKPLAIQTVEKLQKGNDVVFDAKKLVNLMGKEQVSLRQGLEEEYAYFLDKESTFCGTN